MKKLLIGLLFFVQVNFAYAVQFTTLSAPSYGGQSLCFTTDTLAACAEGVANPNYGSQSIATYFPWTNPSTGITYTIHLTYANTAVLMQGSTIVATYPGRVLSGGGYVNKFTYDSGADIGLITPDNIVVYLSVLRSSSNSNLSMACVTYPSMPGYPSFYCYKVSSSEGTMRFYSNVPTVD